MDNIPTLLFILVNTYWIWDFHDKLESMKTARYFIHFSWFKHLFSKINWKSLKIFFCGGWKITILYFCIFNESLLERSHIQTLFSSVFIFCFRIFMSLCLQNRSASSAKRWKSKSVGKRWKSLIYNKKRIGPRYTTGYTSKVRLYAINSNKLLAISKIWRKPVLGNTP